MRRTATSAFVSVFGTSIEKLSVSIWKLFCLGFLARLPKVICIVLTILNGKNRGPWSTESNVSLNVTLSGSLFNGLYSRTTMLIFN